MKRKLAIVLTCGMVAFGMTACSGETATPEPQAESVTESVAESTPAPTEEAVLGVGSTADVNGVKITLNSVTESAGDDIFKPDEGNTYVLCNFTIQNDSEEDLTISSAMCFEAYCDDTAINFDLAGQSTEAATQVGQLDGDVAPGKNMNGVIVYQVPTGYAKLEVSVQPDLLSNDTADFVYNK